MKIVVHKLVRQLRTILGGTTLIKILGVTFSPLTMVETVEKLDKQIDEGTELFHVVTANPEIVMNAKKDDSFMDILGEVEMITPDGIGVVIGSKIIKDPLPERVSGYDLLHKLLRKRADGQKKTTVYMLGAKEDVIKLAVRKLRQIHHKVEIVGYHHGYFDSGSAEESMIVQDIAALQPDLLLVGLGSPRQEQFIHTYKKTLQAKVAIGCGGSFDVLAGVVKRAPYFFQKIGMEWFYRLVQQPSRIKRQLVLPLFIIEVFKTKDENNKNMAD